MTRSPLPENWQELMAGYALGNLSPEEAEAFQQVLAENPHLSSEVNCYQEALGLMPYALPEQDPPPHLRAAILRAAESDQQPATILQGTPIARRGNRTPVWLRLGGAVAALVIGGLAIDNYRLRQEVQDSKTIISMLQQPTTVTYSLAGTGATASASGSVVVNADQRSVVVLVQNLPELPQGRAYRLWAVAKGQAKPAYCGQFNSTAKGSTSTHWSLPEAICSQAVSQLLITAESATAPPIAEGPLVMKSNL